MILAEQLSRRTSIRFRDRLRWRIRLLIFVWMLLGAVTASSQKKFETVELDSVQLYLGQPKSEVLKQLANSGFGTSRNDLSLSGDSFFVYVGTLPKDAQALARIRFTSDRLTSIYKIWTPKDVSGFALGKAIYFASKSLREDGCADVSLKTVEDDKPGTQSRTLIMYCSGTNRRFEISVFDADSSIQGGPAKFASLEEVLEAPTETPGGRPR
jgi:hypothetical protein